MREPNETHIARLLWAWSCDLEAVVEDDDGRRIDQHLAFLLEWFLCDALKHSSAGARGGWWSDGVISLQIKRLTPTSFRMTGTTFWAAGKGRNDWVAPFDVEFSFPAIDSVEWTGIIVRFGWLGHDGEIVQSIGCIHPRERWPDKVIRDSEWAMAIELTPPQ